MFATSITPTSSFTDQSLHQEIAASIQSLLANGQWASYRAPVLDHLKAEIANRIRVSNVRLCSSGSIAMELALRGCGLKEGDEVICPALDYPGNIRAVRLVGASPVVVDVAENRWTLDVEKMADAASDRTRAVIVSHLYGEIADVVTLRKTCDDRGWLLIEDVCQMPGGTIDHSPLGSFGHVAAFSFGGSKPITAGSGGAVVTSDERISQRITSYIDRPSELSPLSPLQAAVLLPQWRRLDALIDLHLLTLKNFVNKCGARFPTWRMPAMETGHQKRCFYKLPIQIETASHRDRGTEEEKNRIIAELSCAHISAGVSFRTIQRVAGGRGRMMGCKNAEAISANCFLLDHRSLAGSSESGERLLESLTSIYDRRLQ